MSTERDTACDGFELLDSNVHERRVGRGLLVPAWVNQERQAETTSAKAVPATIPTPAPTSADTSPKTPPAGANDLASLLHLDDEMALEHGRSLVARILKKHRTGLDALSARFCDDVFAAVSLHVLYSTEHPTWGEVLAFLHDPNWDSTKQLFSHLQCSTTPPPNSDAGRWIFQTVRTVFKLPDSSLERYFRRSVAVIKNAIDALDKPKSHRVKKPAGIPVFASEAMAKAFAHLDKIDDKQRDRAEHDLFEAGNNGGFRTVPNVRKAVKNLDRVAANFENLADPIKHLQTELALAGAMAPSDFRVSPMLLLGDPGIGKTHLALQLATALGVSMDKLSAGSSQAAFQLTGSHPSWNRAMPGSIFTLLATGTSAAPVLVVDEVDKIGDGGQYPLEPTLLDLLERGTATTFKDQFYDLQFDASRIIFVLTANDVTAVPAPLLSRMAVFEVPRPQPAQRLRIIQGEIARLRQKTRKSIDLDATAYDLAERVDVDLRQTLRMCQEAFAVAMMARSATVKLTVPATTRRSIGFMANVAA